MAISGFGNTKPCLSVTAGILARNKLTHTLFPDSAICPNHAEKGRSERAYASKKIISISGHR